VVAVVPQPSAYLSHQQTPPSGLVDSICIAEPAQGISTRADFSGCKGLNPLSQETWLPPLKTKKSGWSYYVNLLPQGYITVNYRQISFSQMS